MGSWVRCKCDHLVHKNLFCGTGVFLIATEDFLDIERPDKSAEQLVSELILNGPMLLRCGNCGRIIILKESKDSYEVEFFKPDNDA